MRRLIPLALLLVLLPAASALAAIGDAGDSEQQTSAYGQFFGYVCAAGAFLVILIGGIQIFKGMAAEQRRGKKTGFMIEEILDKEPRREDDRELYLGEKVPEWKSGNRRAATWAALKLIAKKDNFFEADYMIKAATKSFKAIKAAIELRSTKDIRDRVTPECLARLKEEIKKLGAEGELHVYGKPEVTSVDIVHIEVPEGKEKHTFTALVSVRSQDFIRDEKTGKVLKGDKKVYAYQEFWTFRRSDTRWLVDQIRSSSFMDAVLHAKNVLTRADRAAFAKKADPKHVQEFLNPDDDPFGTRRPPAPPADRLDTGPGF